VSISVTAIKLAAGAFALWLAYHFVVLPIVEWAHCLRDAVIASTKIDGRGE